MRSKILRLFICVYIVYCLICYFEDIKSSVLTAISIWSDTIIPSVFPYIILSKYLSGSDILDIFETFPGKFIARFFRISPCSTRAVICSLFCGYPSGAICAKELYERNYIEKNESKRLICFTNNAGPLFLISAIGGGMLKSIYKGFAIYIIHIVSALIYGFITSIGENTKSLGIQRKVYIKPDLSVIIKESVCTTVNICGFMIIAFVLARCSQILTVGLIPKYIDKAFISTCINGVFEISAGVSSATSLNYSSFVFGVICGIVSWSGISVIMQIKSIAGDIVSTKDIIMAKFFQSIISFFAGYMFDKISGQNSTIVTSGKGIIFSLILSIILFIYYVFAKKKKLSD